MSRIEVETISELLSSETSLILSANKDNEYVLNDCHIFSRPRSVYFDDHQKKIAEIIRIGNYISITLFVAEQVNLFFDLTTDFLNIEAQGPLCIDGVFNTNKAIKLKALSAHFCNNIQSQHMISFEIQNTLSFEKLMKADFLSVVAGKLHNMGSLRVEKFADLAVDHYQQMPTAECQINGCWRFLGDTCELANDFVVQQKSFIKAKQLIMGHDEARSSINLQGGLYLDIDDFEIEGTTSWIMSQKLSSTHQNLIVRNGFKLGERSTVTISNARLDIAMIHNEGDFQTKDCELVIKRCYQKNKIDFNNSEVMIHEEFTQENNATTQTSDNEKNKSLTIKKLSIKSGKMKLVKTPLFGEQWNVHWGTLEVQDSELNMARNLFVYEPATLQLVSSTIKVKQNIILNGLLTFNGCSIACQSIDAQGSQQTSVFQHSLMDVEQDIILWKNLQINHVHMISHGFSFKGELQADDMVLQIEGPATWQLSGSSAKNIKLSADRIDFNGDASIDKISCFSGSYFQGQVINHQGTTRFLDSEIHGNGQEDRSHGIEGKMQLENSQFFTKSQVFHYKGSQVDLLDKSKFIADVIANNGQISAADSTVVSKKLVQNKAEFHSQHSQVYVATKVYNNDSKMSFTDKSEVMVGDMVVDGSLMVKDSVIQSKKSLISLKDSKITGEGSVIDSVSMFLIGSVKMAKTLLNSREMIIFNQFSAMDGSLIKITQEMSIAQAGALELEKSQLSAMKVDLFGMLALDQSQVEVKKSLDSWSKSEIEMKGNSVIEGEDIIVRGSLATESQEIKVKENDKEIVQKLMPQIHAQGKLETRFDSAISGDNLIIEAKNMDVEGRIELSESLIARGGGLANVGTIKAKNDIYLGFDDYVTNAGYIDSNNVNIHSNLFNIFGRISAGQTFSNSGFFSLNMGLYCAANTNINSLVSLNSGLVLPNFSNGLSDILSWRNLATASKIVLTNFVPKYSNLINLGFMIPNLYSTVGTFYKNYKDYRSGKSKKFSKMRKHEWMSMICQVKSSTMLIYNACSTTQKSVSEINAGYKALFPEGSESLPTTPDTPFSWLDTGKMMVGALAGSYTDESLMHLNTGFSATINMSKMNLLHCNLGAELALNSQMINSHYVFNSGISYGGDSSILAHQITNSGRIGGFNKLSIIAREVTNYGHIEGNNNKFEIDVLEQKGTVNFTDGVLKVKKWREGQGAASRLENLIMKGEVYSTAGKVKGNKVHFDFVQSVKTEVGAILDLQNSSVKTASFTHAGTINYQDQLKIEAETFHTQQGSQLQGASSQPEELEVTETITDKQGQEKTVTKLVPKHRLIIESKETTLGGRQSGGDDTSITGDKLTVEKSGDINLQRATVKQKESILIQGTVTANKSSLESGTLTVAKEGGVLNAQDTFVKTTQLTHGGTINYAGELKVTTDVLHTQEGSQLHGASSQPEEVEVTETIINEQGQEKTVTKLVPKHKLIIESKETTLGGRQSGGDYTSITGDKLTVEKSGDINLQRAIIKQKESILIQGTVTTNKSSLESGTVTVAKDGGILNAQDTFVQATQFIHAGTINYQGQFKVQSDSFHSEEGSQLQGASSKQEEVEIIETVTDEQGQEKTVTKLVPRHKLIIESKETTLGGNQSGGDFTSITGDKLTVETSGNIILQHAAIEQKTTVIRGDVTANKTNINSEKLTLEQEGSLVASHTQVKTQQLEQKGILSLSDSHLHADQFSDQEGAVTSLTRTSAEGANLHLKGHLKAQDVTLGFSDSVINEASSHREMDNVSVKTKKFEGGGTTNYRNTYQIDTDTYQSTTGSHVKGEKSQTQAETNEPKPTHVFVVNAKEMTLAGKQEGGDYTQMTAENSIQVNKGENFNIEHGYLKTAKTIIEGQMTLDDHSHLESQKTTVSESGALALNKSSIKGEELTSYGKTSYADSYVEVDHLKFSQSASEFIKDSTFKTKVFNDDSQMNYQGQVIIDTEKYSHGGRVQIYYPPERPEANLFVLKAKEARLSGSAQIGNGLFDIEHFDQGSQLVSGTGKFSNYQFQQSFDFRTQDQVNLTDKLQRDCNLYVTGSEVTLSAKYKSQNQLSFKSTKGNVNLLAEVKAGSVFVDSAAEIYTNNLVYADQNIQLTAKGGYYNLGGKLDGDVVTVQAAEIMNITQGSQSAKSHWQFGIGKDGVINGRSRALLEATAGNIENHGGVIRGGDYLQLVASGNILNLCNQKSYRGKYDTITQYDPALIVGGRGASADGLGLFVQAGGKVKCDASNFLAEGDIFIDGVKGVKFEARHDTYVSKDKTKKKWYGKKTHEIETHTDIYNSTVRSANGRSIIRSSEGEVKSVATIFSSAGGTDIYAHQSVKLFSLKTQDKTYKSKEHLWGLTKSSRKEMHESSAPTLFIDNGFTRIHSEVGHVDARGALFLGDGDLSIKAGKKIKLGCDILNHKVTEKSQSISFSGFGIGAFNAVKNGRGFLGAFAAEDTTFAKLDKLLSSENLLETGVNTSNLAQNAFNTTNDLMRGITNNNLTDELLSRYRLGDMNGFNPSFNVNFNRSKTTDEYQTLGAGGIDRRHVYLEAGQGIDLENGVRVHARGDMHIISPEINATAAKLKSSHKQETRGMSVGMNAAGEVADVGVNYSKQKTKSVHYANAELSADGHMDLGAVDIMSLDGANVIADSLSGHIKKLEIESKQDTSHSSTKQLSVSTSGQVSAFNASESSRVVSAASGIHVKQGINHEQETFTVDEYHSIGGTITSDGQNNFKARTIVTEDLHDSHNKQGVGISLNVHDLGRITGAQKPKNGVGEKAIAGATLSVDHKDFQAVQHGVIHGAQGTKLEVEQLRGEIHTQDAGGYEVKRDRSVSVAVDVPLTNQEYLTVARDNITAGAQKLMEKPIIIVPEIKEKELEPEVSFVVPEIKEKEVETEVSQEITPSFEEKSLPPQKEQTLMKEALLSSLQLASPEQRQEVNSVLDQVVQELSVTKQVSPATQAKVDSVLKDVLLTAVKAGGEYGLGKLASIDPHVAIKSFYGTTGLMFTFAMNVASSKVESVSGSMQDAALATASDLIVDFSLKCVLGAGSGPIGWVMTSIDIADKLIYSDKTYESLTARALPHVEAAYAAEDPAIRDMYFEMAENQHEMAGMLDLAHTAAEIVRVPAEFVKQQLETIIGSTPAPLPQPVQQNISTPPTPEIPNLSQNNQNFFNSLPKKVELQPVSIPELTS